MPQSRPASAAWRGSGWTSSRRGGGGTMRVGGEGCEGVGGGAGGVSNWWLQNALL